MKIYIYEVKLGCPFCYREEDAKEGIAFYMPMKGQPAYFRPNHRGRLYKSDEGKVMIDKTGGCFMFLTEKNDKVAQKAFHDFYMDLHEKILLLAEDEKQQANMVLSTTPVKAE